LKAKEIRQNPKDGDKEFQDYPGFRIVDKVMDYDTNNVERQFNRIRLILK